jgi:hypothetical protein
MSDPDPKHEPKYTIMACSDGPFEDLLGLNRPAITTTQSPFKQLREIESYVTEELGAKSILLEDRYVDRDHLHDHGAYHAGSLQTETSRCRRIHFFRIEKSELRARLEDLQAHAAQGADEFLIQCAAFSRDAYLGFSVIRPLDGSCVGRTQLAAPPEPSPESKALGAGRVVIATRRYTAHVAGIPLAVDALPFQQQDLAVSRCATVSIWTALQQARALEPGSNPSPTEITRFAARYSLPNGRAMPSEGLTTEQMCQAIDAAQLAPVFHRTRDRTSRSD